MTFTVGDGNRQAAANHATEEDRRRGLDFNHGNPRLELLGTVAHKARPVVAARDQLTQVGEHLAAVAHAQGEGVRAGKERGESFTGDAVEQDRLGPALTGAEDVAVGEAAAGDQTAEVGQVNAAAEDVAHVHVDRAETGAVEGCRHLDLTVDTLLTQNGDTRAHPIADERCGNVVVDVEAEQRVQTRVGVVGDVLEFLIGALGVVTQALNLPAGFAPGLLPDRAGVLQHRLAVELEANALLAARLADHRAAVTQTGGRQLRQHFLGVVLGYLNDRAQFFVEQHLGQCAGVLCQYVEVDVQATAGGKGHLGQSGEQATVGAVVVGKQQLVLVQALDHGKEGLEVFGIVQIRHLLADLVVDLRQRRAAQTVLATAQINQDQIGCAMIQTQLRGQGGAHVLYRGKTGNDQRQRRGNRLLLAGFIPAGLHGHGVLADRNGDAQLGAQLHADCLDGVVQARVFTRVTGSRHPVGRQFDVGQLGDTRGSQVGHGLGNRHAPGGRGVEQRQRRALTHGHGFTGVDVEAGGGDGTVSHRHLPGADHLVAGDHTGDAAVADGDQELFAGYRRQAQYALGGIVQVQLVGAEVVALLGFALDAAVHARRLAEQNRERHIDRLVVEVAVVEQQQLLFSRFTNHGEGATLTLADGFETLEIGVRHGHHVAFLGFVGPDFQRAHARLVVRYIAQLETAAATTVVDQLREGIGQAARAHVVDKGDRVLVTQLPAAVDDLLTAAFHFRVLTLHGGKVQILGAGTGGHGRRRAAAQTNQHRRAAQHDQLGANRNVRLLDVGRTNVAHATSDHDRLVVTTGFRATGRVDGGLEGTEVTVQVRTTEFVVERSAAERAFDHDLQRRHDARRLAVVFFPRLNEARNTQVGHGKPGQAGLRLAADAGGAFVTNLATRTGRRARERGNRGRVVVGLHLHQDVYRLFVSAVLITARHREETASGETFDYRGVVLIGRQHAFAVHLIGVLDHAEQALVLRLTVDIPAGIEDLVTAVLGVGLGEHHQLDVARVATKAGEALDQIVDLVFGQCQTQAAVGFNQCIPAAGQNVDTLERLGLGVGKQRRSGLQIVQRQLGHAVVQLGFQRRAVIGRQLASDVIGDTALQTQHLTQTAVAGDIGRLAGPGRDSAEARHYQHQLAGRLFNRHGRTVAQQTIKHLRGLLVQLAAQLGEMHELGVNPGHSGKAALQPGEQLGTTKIGKGWGSTQDMHVGIGLGMRTVGKKRRIGYPKRAGWAMPCAAGRPAVPIALATIAAPRFCLYWRHASTSLSPSPFQGSGHRALRCSAGRL